MNITCNMIECKTENDGMRSVMASCHETEMLDPKKMYGMDAIFFIFCNIFDTRFGVHHRPACCHGCHYLA